ncbi:MAG: hypothetical protein OEM01_13030 [Desulfobulbaceae bacterium]|nr:hypothetical protein [Desulfobulbaceae bacterium]
MIILRLNRHFLPALLTALFCTCSFAAVSAETNLPYDRVYRIPLRVHLGKSNRPPEQWRTILEEINTIWLSQGGICFDIHTVGHDEKMSKGMDLWFEAAIPEWNGYYYDHHDMHVRDDPDLRPAQSPARSSAARTAAHELGHALNLMHLQNSDDNLMRSKTYGWQLHPGEIKIARENAQILALAETDRRSCTVRIHNNP